MVDNVAITAGSGTSITADDISSVFYQRVKIAWGVDGSAVDASATNPFPVVINTNGQATMANSTPVVIASNQSAVPVSINTNGQATMTNSTPVVISSNQSAVAVKNGQAEYETVAASQTAQVLGATGGTGDYIAGVLVIPATTSPGNVILLDNATSITIFTGGATSVSNLVPFYIPIGANSVSGAWKLTTGANVSAIGFGDFT